MKLSHSLKKITIRRSLPRPSAILIPLAGFILILSALNGYQYFKLRSNLSEPIINEISDAKIRDMQTFFDTISDKLQIVRDWGRNDVLSKEDIISLNKKFIPFIEHQTTLSGVLLASSKGWEYYLSPEGTTWITRIRSKNHPGILSYQQWETPEKSIKKWQKKSNYSPLERPWFHRSEEKNSIYWTDVYTFYEKNIRGISASVSWDSAKTPGEFTVFAFDFSLEELRQLLTAQNINRQGVLFLLNPYSDSFILADREKAQGSSKIPDIISQLIHQWKQDGQPATKVIRLADDRQHWLATFKPVLKKNSLLWVGVAASEKELVSGLTQTLFDIDMVDLLVACAGGGAMLLLIWLNGGLRSPEKEKEDPVLRVHRLINQGEGNNVEFKSSVRMNLKNGKTGKEIEFAWLKAVIAFLNSDGGMLLIGVADNGKILGLDADNFENDDRCLLHIKNLFNQHVGAEFSDFVSFTLLEVDEKKIVTAHCRPAGKPVFLKVGKNEEFFIRSGPSNSKLTPSQMIRYIQQKN
jgi:hypothetical protein